MALQYCHENYSGRPIEIRSDSAYCVNMLKPGGWVYGWEKNGWTRGKKHEPIENLEIIQKIYKYLLICLYNSNDLWFNISRSK